MAKLFLGLDSSTQSLSAVVIDLDTRKVIYEKSLNFDRALPQFKTQNGVLPNRDPLVKHSSPLLWAAALDLLFAQMKKDGVALGKILAISGSGQQHGSVYLNEKAADALANLNPKKSLVENLRRRFRAQDLADLDGFLDRQGMRRNPQKTRRHQIHRLAHRFGHVRAFHRAADPQILQDRAQGLRQDRAHRAGQFVHGLAARRQNRAD